jgi:predicted metal-dependent phosphoesterase TrpH
MSEQGILGDFHIHTRCSLDGKKNATVENILRHAILRKIRLISLTDHDTVLAYKELPGAIKLLQTEYAAEDIPVVVRGVELSSHRMAHLLFYGLPVDTILKNGDVPGYKYSVEDMIKWGRDQGDEVKIVVPHPKPYRGITSLSFGYVRRLAEKGLIDGIEIVNGEEGKDPLLFQWFNLLRRKLAHELQLTEFGNSDAHGPEEVGSAVTILDSSVRDEASFLRAVPLRRFKARDEHGKLRLIPRGFDAVRLRFINQVF